MGKKQEKSTNSQFAIDIAEGFYQTGISLAKQAHHDNSRHGFIWIPPGVVNFSFATELILKAVIFYDLRKKAWGHKLFDLYQTLSEPTKAQIVENYKRHKLENQKLDTLRSYKIVIGPANSNKGSGNKESNFDEIRNLLKIHSESFENWRYIYEFGQAGYCYEFDFNAMDAFYKALKDVLVVFLSAERPSYGMKQVEK